MSGTSRATPEQNAYIEALFGMTLAQIKIAAGVSAATAESASKRDTAQLVSMAPATNPYAALRPAAAGGEDRGYPALKPRGPVPQTPAPLSTAGKAETTVSEPAGPHDNPYMTQAALPASGPYDNPYSRPEASLLADHDEASGPYDNPYSLPAGNQSADGPAPRPTPSPIPPLLFGNRAGERRAEHDLDRLAPFFARLAANGGSPTAPPEPSADTARADATISHSAQSPLPQGNPYATVSAAGQPANPPPQQLPPPPAEDARGYVVYQQHGQAAAAARPLPVPPGPPSNIPFRSRWAQSIDLSASQVGKPIKSGAFGKICWVDSKNGNPPLVIKLPANAAHPELASALLEKEATMNARVTEHPNIAKCLGMRDVGGQHGLVMEGIKGKDLTGTMQRLEKLRQGDPTALSEAGMKRALSQEAYVGTLQYIMTQTLQGLVHLEKEGIIHNDIRPDNIMCDAVTGNVKIIDFGIAFDARESTRRQIAPIKYGTVSPEFYAPTDTPVNSRHDVFAAGDLARSSVERALFDYQSGKPSAQIEQPDARAFGQPDASGQPRRALTPMVKMTSHDKGALPLDRCSALIKQARSLAAYPSVRGKQAATDLLAAVKDTIELVEVNNQPHCNQDHADALTAAADHLETLLQSIAPPETTAALSPQDPATQARELIERADSIIKRANVLTMDAALRGTAVAARLQEYVVKFEPHVRVLRMAVTLRPIDDSTRQSVDRLAKAIALFTDKVELAEQRLKRSGTYGAETAYTEFVNSLMDPDASNRPTPAEALKHPFLADRLLNDDAARAVLKRVARPPLPPVPARRAAAAAPVAATQLRPNPPSPAQPAVDPARREPPHRPEHSAQNANAPAAAADRVERLAVPEPAGHGPDDAANREPALLDDEAYILPR